MKVSAALLILSTFCLNVRSESISICTDGNQWYPYTYTENEKALGLHVDIVNKACESVNWKCNFQPFPWKRCLHYVETGAVDGVVSASYKEKRAKYMEYPPQATEKTSPWRITQAEYVIVTMAGYKKKFNGEFSQIPLPVRAPLGYSISDDMKNNGLDVLELKDAYSNFVHLYRTGKGSVVTIPRNARKMMAKDLFANRFRVHEKPIQSKSYFFGISKLSRLTPEQRLKIWEAIVHIREDEKVFDELLSKY